MRIIFSVLFCALASCADFGFANFDGSPQNSEVIVAGSSVLVPLENSMFSFDQDMPLILADRARIARVVAQSWGEGAGMQDLCRTGPGTPDIVLLTRSPEMVEIRRCEAFGVQISADLVAIYSGGMRGAPDFAQVWIAFVPDRVQRNAAAARAVRLLRYDFARLIEGTEYEPYFAARRI